MLNAAIDTSEVQRELHKIETFVDRDLIPLAAVIALSAIKELSAGGLDTYGKPFKPYTKPYEKFKLKKLGSASPVNMRLNNEMLKSPTLQGDELAFWDDEQNKKALGNMKKRKFFAASKMLANIIGEGISKHLNRL